MGSVSFRSLSLALIICGAVCAINAQDAKIMAMSEYMPSLQGCESKSDRNDRRSCTKEKLAQHIAETTSLPKEAKAAGQEGVAVVEVVVMSDGSVEGLSLVDDPGYGMGEAALKSIKKLNKLWAPGEHFGEKVNVRMKIPVAFHLPEEEPEPEPVATPDVYMVAEVMPAYEGCGGKSDAKQCTFEALNTFVSENLKYPAEAKAAGVEGTVTTSFVIDKTGAVTEAKVEEGLGHGCDEEALRIVNAMPNWIPGADKKQPVKVKMTLPVRFKLKEKE